MEDLYTPRSQRKKHGILQYCWDCLNNPISWVIVLPTLGAYHIFTGAVATSEDFRQVALQSQNYQELFYHGGQILLEKIFSGEAIVSAIGFVLGGKIYRFFKHR